MANTSAYTAAACGVCESFGIVSSMSGSDWTCLEFGRVGMDETEARASTESRSIIKLTGLIKICACIFTEETTLLSLQCIEKRFDGVRVLSGLSFLFENMERYTLLGANGSGKTTLLNLISGFIQADAGKVVFKGKQIIGDSTFKVARRGIARTFQSIKLFGSHTVAENMFIALRGKPDETLWGALLGGPSNLTTAYREKVDEMLEEFHLQNHRAHLACELSYGQQKLLHFAMATANPFDILLLDEPVAGLQPEFVNEMLGRIKKIKKMVIVVEHNVDFIKGLESEVLFLANGRIIAHGRYDNLMSNKDVWSTYM